MSKQPTGSICIGNTIYFPIYLPASLPRSLNEDLEKSRMFPILVLSIYIDRLAMSVTCINIYSAILPCGSLAGLVLQPSTWNLGGTAP